MVIKSLRTYHFRNLADLLLPVSHKHIVLIGENGQGKSNFIEAIYFVSYGSSFRTRLQKQIVSFGEQELSVIAVIGKDGRDYTVKVVFKDGKRRTFIDGREITDRKELLSISTCIIFSHEDMEFVKGAPLMQRKFFDQSISLLDNDYIDLIRLYNSIVKQRNALLKGGSDSLLTIYDRKLADTGMKIQEKRRQNIEAFNEYFPELYRKISCNPDAVSLVYSPSWKGCITEEDAVTLIEKNHERDRRYELTTTGPHRDKFLFSQDGRDFIATASTGQIRLASLVLKLVQSILYCRERDEKPILLLDDVLLELDLEKRERFLEHISDYDQAFFTFLPKESYFREHDSDTMTYRVSEGVLENE